MNHYYIGAYWNSRKLTLREYADATKQFIGLLCKTHSVFNDLYYVGSKPNAEVKLEPNLDNLDDLIYQESWDRKIKYEKANADGSPIWETVDRLGFGMTYDTGKSEQNGGVGVSIRAGKFSPWLTNSVTISFPLAKHPAFPHPEFYEYTFAEQLLELTVNFWKPEAALLTEVDFSDEVDFEFGSDTYQNNWSVGLLTYLENPKVAVALPADIEHHRVEAGGELFVTTREIADVENPSVIEKAIRIRDYLHQRGLLAKKEGV
jgi:hypothetical protein